MICPDFGEDYDVPAAQTTTPAQAPPPQPRSSPAAKARDLDRMLADLKQKIGP
jgi:hypothetical protein